MSAAPSVTNVNHLFTRKVQGGVFATALASVSTWHDAEDRVQDGLVQTWDAFRRHHEATGHLLSDATLARHCRRRSRSRRDSFVPRGKRGKWTLDLSAIHERGLAPEGVHFVTDGEPVGTIADLDFQLDVHRALAKLAPHDQQLALGLMLGYTTRELAAQFGSSSPTVCRATARLRRSALKACYG